MSARAPLVLCLGVLGCFSPDLGSEPFLCGGGQPRCPPGYTCSAGICARGVVPDGALHDGRTIDAGSDAPSSCTVGVRCAGDELVTCSAAHLETSVHCPLGCNALDTPRCYVLVPSNLPADVCERPTTSVRRVTGISTLDTTACTGGMVVTQNAAPSICLFVHSEIAIESTGLLRPTGDKVLALVSTGTLKIDGKIDLGGHGGTPGAGAGAGFLRGAGSEQLSRIGGGGGAGHATSGGAGAAADTGGKAGVNYGGGDLRPLVPGSPGGPGCSGTCAGEGGGTGGGAIQLVACGDLELSGSILAGGEGGQGGRGGNVNVLTGGGGSGGGSGGAILIEAPAITMPTGSILAANGGGGGGGGEISGVTSGKDGLDGLDGQASVKPATGGPGANPGPNGESRGGNGGTSAGVGGQLPENGTVAPSGNGNGGGGGAAGRIRLNTREGKPPVMAGGVASPGPTTGTVGRK